MSDRDTARQVAHLRSLLTLARELLQSDDAASSLELVGRTLAEATQMSSALLLFRGHAEYEAIGFDRSGLPRPVDWSHPLYPHASDLLAGAGTQTGGHADDAERTARNVLAVCAPSNGPVAALALACDQQIGRAELDERKRIPASILELALAALGKIQTRNAMEKLQCEQMSGSPHAHAAGLERRDALETEMRLLSLTDVLTGLRNRRGFMLHAEQLFKLAQRQHAHSAVIFADVDDLKLVNDELGHDAGDHLLRDAAAVFRESFRGADVIARLGGDEFVAYTLDDEHPKVILGRIYDNLRAFNLMQERPYTVSISAGIVQCDPDGEQSLLAYIQRADQQMYEHKRRRLH
ncbi:MAG: diguanylate cyclase domain-containing protein [Massilia sp.]